MDGITSVDTAVSGGEAASPVAADSSVSVAETTPAAIPAAEAQITPEANSGETVAATPEIEFPDDAAFQSLTGEERKSNWQQARSRIGELNQQVRELSERAAIAAQIEQLGGMEQLQQYAQIAQGLFSHQQDEMGNPVTDPQTGLPYLTAKPFIEQLQQGSPDAFYTMAWETLDQPLDGGGTVGEWLLQQKYGLDPSLLDTYKQIQSPQDAARYTQQAGGITSQELEWVPAEFQDAYKTFDAAERQRLLDLQIDDEQGFLDRLNERKELIDSRKFRDEIRAQQEQAKQAQQQQWEQQIQRQAAELVQTKREALLKPQMEQIRKFTPFGPDSQDNEMVWSDIENAGEMVFNNPAIRAKAESAGNLIYQYQRYAATGNTMLASQALAKADQIAMEISREWAKAATTRMNKWGEILKGRASAGPATSSTQTQSATQAQSIAPQNVSSQPRPVQGPQRFGLSPDRINQIASQLALQKNGAA